MNNAAMTWKGIEKLKSLGSVDAVNAGILTHIPVTKNALEKEGVFIFGVGKLGQRVYDFLVASNIPVHGFVDNNPEKQKLKFNGLPVIPSAALKQDANVYIASATFFNPIYKQLLQLGLTKLFSHVQAGILFYGDKNFPVEMYQENLTEDLITNKTKYLEVFDLLDDADSKKVFDNLVSFRLSLEQRFIDDMHTQISKEYFDSAVIDLGQDEVYFDVGGFDGDSAENFIKFVDGKYKGVHIFEPDSALLNKAKVRLKEHKNIVFNPLGIYDKKTTLYFDITGGLDGIISDQGNMSIETTTVDEYTTGQPTYIKFDVEGVEIEAINGAVSTIKKSKPKMAIASYHFPKHIWEIPLLVKGINPAYKLRLRHYTDSVFDSIFYFI